MSIKRGLPEAASGGQKLPSQFSKGHKQVSREPMPVTPKGNYSKNQPAIEGPPFMAAFK